MNSNMSTNAGFTGADIEESQFGGKNYLHLLQSNYGSIGNGGVQTPTFSTAISNYLGNHNAAMLSELPLAFEQGLALKQLQQLQLQLNSPAGSPSSTLSLSTIYTDLISLTDALGNGPKITQSVLTHLTDAIDTGAIQSQGSFVDTRDSTNNQSHQYEADMGPARNKSRGNHEENFQIYTYFEFMFFKI